jgi:hypothetical protein
MGGWRFEISLGKKFVRLHLSQWLRTVVGACHPSYSGECKLDDCDQGQSQHKVTAYLKNNHCKK